VANQALEHGYACIYSTECLFIRFNVPPSDGWIELQKNSKNPSQHEVVILASRGAPWDIIGCLRRQKLVMRVPENRISFVLLVHCNDQLY